MSSIIPKAYVDWDYDEDESGRYKFAVDRRDHDLVPGDEVTVRCLADGEETKATVVEVHDAGVILQTDDIDITEEYSIEKA